MTDQRLHPNHTSRDAATGSQGDEGDHLQYLLTAYVFDNLSAAGREEVEAHLRSCAECREELERLRETLGEVETALREDATEYVFEERRRRRIMEAAKNEGFRLLPRLYWPGGRRLRWGLTALAGMLALFFVGSMFMTAGSSYDAPIYGQAKRRPSRPFAERAATKSEAYYDAADASAEVEPEEAPASGFFGFTSRSPKKSKAPAAYEKKISEAAKAAVPADAPLVTHEEVEVADFNETNGDMDRTVTATLTNKYGPNAKSATRGGQGGRANWPAKRRDKLAKLKKKPQEEITPDASSISAVGSIIVQGGGRGTSSGGGGAFVEGVDNARGEYQTELRRKVGRGAPATKRPVPKPEPAPPPSQEGKPARRQRAISGKEYEIRREESKLAEARKPEERYSPYRERSEAEAIEKAQKGKVLAKKERTVREAYERVSQLKEDGKSNRPASPGPLSGESQKRLESAMNKIILEADDEAYAMDEDSDKKGGKKDMVQALNEELLEEKPRNMVPQTESGGQKQQQMGKVARKETGVELKKVMDGLHSGPFQSMNGQTLGRAVQWQRSGQQQGQQQQQVRVTGDKGLSDVFLGGSGTVTALGIGGGGGGSFGTKAFKVLRQRGARESFLRSVQYYQNSGTTVDFKAFAKRPFPIPPPLLTDEGLDEDEFLKRYNTRPFVDAARDNLSTFAMDVDTGSYTRSRAQLRRGKLPDPKTVRVEEFVNYFKQDYEVAGEEAFGVFAEGGPAPFAGVRDVELLKIGIKSRDPRPNERKPAILTIAVDTSGSMARGDRLNLVQQALLGLVQQLRPEDAVCIVAFGGQAELVLPRTFARQKQRILDAIRTLTPRGGTNVEVGLNMAYRMADEVYSPEAVNRVILCSDGVANVGAKGPEQILKRVKVFAARGIDLATVGFGMSQYNDKMMERLANNGNGSSYFVDSAREARRVFTEQLPPHLDVLARDAKVQVQFNADVVERYRLLGYENRKIADKDFRNDAVDAGEVGHSTLVTALYEIKRKPLSHGPIGKVFLRWKDAGYRHLPVIERNYPLSEGIIADSMSRSSPQLRFLACVAEFAELLRESRWARDGSYAAALSQLHQLPPSFTRGNQQWREIVELVTKAQALSIPVWIEEVSK